MKNQLKIKQVKTKENVIWFDFFVDGKQLSQLLNIDRFDMMYSSFDLDIFYVDKIKFPYHNTKEIIDTKVSVFLGYKEPENQFGTNRIPLYRCHCGSDYCGVISFLLEKKEDVIIWKDIRYEDDSFEDVLDIEDRKINTIKMLKFDSIAYQAQFVEYLNNNVLDK